MALSGSIVTNEPSARITGGAGGDGGDTDTNFPELADPGRGGNDMWGANGGAGGAGVYGVTMVLNGAGAAIMGGAGGNAGVGDQWSAFDLEIHNEAKGGAGGAGVVVLKDTNGALPTVNNEGSITGGAGGHGGDALTTGPDTTFQSVGGAGGNGIESNGATIVSDNGGTISGGAGGAGGIAHATDATNGNGGDGGDGINGSNLTVVNSAIIEGGGGGVKGENGSGTAVDGKNGYGVHFTGGTNTLEIRKGSKIYGGVFADAGTDNTFILGGSDGDIFDGILSTQTDGTGDYQGFQTFEKKGSSNWTLTKVSDVSWTINEGTLTIGDGGGLGTAGTSVDTGPSTSEKGILAFKQSAGSTEVDTTITGKGKVVQDGQSTVTLVAANTYEGGTDLNAGVISVGQDDALGAATSDLNFNGGTLRITDTGMQSTARTIQWGGNGGGFDIDDAGNTFTIAQDLASAGTLLKKGAGTLVLTDLSAFAGAVAIDNGKLQIGDGGTTGKLGTGSSVTIADGASLVLDRTGNDLFIGQTISGRGQLVQQGEGKTILAADNQYTGNTIISAGALQLGNGGAAGSVDPDSVIDISTSAELVIDRGTVYSFNNKTTGDGKVVVDGPGTVSFTNTASDYSGGTELVRGKLIIASDNLLGTGDLILNGGTLSTESPFAMTRDISVLGVDSDFEIGTPNDLTLTGTFTGDNNSAFTKTGDGRLIFDSSADASGFAGTANVNEGVLLVNSNRFGGKVIVNNGGTLAGSGTVGDTHVEAGGTLAGKFSTTLTISGDLIVDTGSTIGVDIGGTTFDTGMFNVTGNLTLNGKLDVTTSGNAAPGIYRIFDYNPIKTMDDTGFQLGTIDGTLANPDDWKLEDTNPGQINLVNMQGMTFVVWDGSRVIDGDGVHGGNGTWDVAETNWKDYQSQTINGSWADGSVAVFKAASGTVIIDDQAGDVNAAGLVFETDGYRITGDPLNLVQGTSGTTPFIQVGVNNRAYEPPTAMIATVLHGHDGLNKTGDGTLVLTNNSDYTGKTTVSAGILQLGDNTLDGMVQTDIDLKRDSYGNGALVFKRSNDVDFEHSISGGGEVFQSGSGTTTFFKSNSFSGGLTVEAGRAKAGIAETAFGSGRVAVEKGATLDLDSFNETVGGLVGNKDGKGDGEIQLGSGTLTLNQDFYTDFSGKISGTGGLIKNENGTLTLSGTNDYSGVTVVYGGTLLQGAKGAFSRMSAYSVANDAALELGSFATDMASLSNGGTVDFGGSGGTALHIAGNYIGNGGTLVMNTVLGDDNSNTDTMKVDGSTSGTTTVVVKNRGGLGAQTLNGIELIDVGGKSDGAFDLKGDYTTKDGQAAILTSSAYAYTLQKGDAHSSNTNDWYLVSQYTGTNPDGPSPNCSDPNGCSNNPSGPSRFSPAAPVYTSYAASMQALNQLPTLQQRRGDQYIAKKTSAIHSDAGETDGQAIWARIEGAHNRLEPNTTAGRVQQDVNTVIMQAGVDGQFYEDENGRLIAGITGQYGNGRAKTSSEFDDSLGGGQLNTQGWGLGGTITWYGNDGFYVDGQAQANWYKTDLSFGGGNKGLSNDNNGFGYALSVESGKRFDLDEHWSLTPQAQLMFSSVDFDTFSDSYGATVSNRDGNSLNGRVGLAANYANSWQGTDSRLVNANVYGIANVYQEFLDGTSINYGGTRMKADQDRTWAGVGFGGTYAWADNKYSIYGEGTLNTSLNHFADSYAVKGNVGFRVNW
ncbi:autotransporter outer membrane beta-barrel domain-containing protein [Ochrobactrum sp. Q0168]|uniref:autotransporter outer membrane beta-barrel domain-containing protein n=1 Tax=Ochrobactrum sp. Q0168 TaxID=2793241 RepID=UPI0018ED7EB6|nr:autotransporter outer membrane beta-barrel domain-containing protein [Ochrobactrum sp. Q0168]